MEAQTQSSSGEEFAVGCILAIKTTLGEEFQAQVITFDPSSNLLILHILRIIYNLYIYIYNEYAIYFFHFIVCKFFNCYRKIQEGVKSESGPKRNIRLLKANYIKEFTFLGQGEDPLDVNKCFLDLNTLQAREDSAIRQAEIDAERRIGVGVTAEAQSIFDALAKTLPVRWDKTNIVVMNEVHVSSPYLPENVTGGTPAANERVRKVLEFEKKRLQARGAGQ